MLKQRGKSSRKNVTETVVQIDVYIKTKDNFKDNEIKNVKKGKKNNLFFRHLRQNTLRKNIS